ncbi:MAG TPA: hypothetical protein VD833_22095 [Vicinamibacterales bacterium]|nr:hypothetical protein [Vicinamibacterales bacterium]
MTTTPSAMTELATLAQRIRGEYQEMPGLRLTGRQACRLWHLESGRCDAILDALVKTGFLLRLRDGSFIKA